MNDTISRQAVRLIESDPNAYPQEWNDDYEEGFTDALNKVLALPSAQPEIIHCAEYKWFQCNMRPDGYLCRHWLEYCDSTDYCSYAERKNET